MRLADLERELAAAGFTFVRQHGSHRVYHDAEGRTLTIVGHHGGRWGRTYCRGELAAIRRNVERLRLGEGGAG